MLRSAVTAYAIKRGARFVPGGWVTMLALSPRGRAAIKLGALHLHKQYRKRH